MKNLTLLGLEELSLNDLTHFNGGATVNQNSIGNRLGGAAARTVGNLLGIAKLGVDAFGDFVAGKYFEKIF